MKKKLIASLLVMCSMAQLAVPCRTVKAQMVKGLEAEAIAKAYEDALDSNLTMDEALNEVDKRDLKDDDGDGLANYWEDAIETDKNNADTDGDGLTDYEEVVLTGTDPLLADTDENGILDKDEDSDEDGLANLEELKLGTNPLSGDTDEDGLTDWEEVHIYKTNPTVFDTDEDGASDGLEAEKMNALVEGFDPLKVNSNMETLLASEGEKEKPEQVMTADLTEDADSETFDSDGDGIPDFEDTAPFERGLEGGIIGSLQVVGSHNPDAMFTEGHSFLVYTSYVDNQVVKVNELLGSYGFNAADYQDVVKQNENMLSWRSQFTERTPENNVARKEIADDMWQYKGKEVDTYVLNRGEYLTIGNFTQNSYVTSLKDGFLFGQSGTMFEMVVIQALFEKATGKNVDIMYIMAHFGQVMKKIASKSYIDGKDVIDGTTDGGIWINREMYDQRYQYDQYPHEIYKVDITEYEFNNMMQALNSNNYYSMLNHNCTSVASAVWNATVGYETDEYGYYLTDKKGKRIKSDLFINARGKMLLSIMDFPGALCEQVLEMKKKGTKRGYYYSENSKIVQGTLHASSNGNVGGSGVPDGSETSRPEDSTPEVPPVEESNGGSSSNGSGIIGGAVSGAGASANGSVGESSATGGASSNGTGNSLNGTGSSSDGTQNSSDGNSSAGTVNSSNGTGNSSNGTGNSSEGSQNGSEQGGGLLDGVFGFIGGIFSFVFGW